MIGAALILSGVAFALCDAILVQLWRDGRLAADRADVRRIEHGLVRRDDPLVGQSGRYKGTHRPGRRAERIRATNALTALMPAVEVLVVNEVPIVSPRDRFADANPYAAMTAAGWVTRPGVAELCRMWSDGDGEATAEIEAVMVGRPPRELAMVSA